MVGTKENSGERVMLAMPQANLVGAAAMRLFARWKNVVAIQVKRRF